jgi:hypothetical protein
VGGLFVIPSGHPPVFFQSADKSFNYIALLVAFSVDFGLYSAALSKGNYRLQASGLDLVTQCVAVIAFVAHDRLGLVRYGLLYKLETMPVITRLTGRQNQLEQAPMSVHKHMNFSAKAAS